MSILSAFEKRFFTQIFELGIVGLCTNPFYIARAALYHAIRVCASEVRGRVLGLGCGTQPYRSLFGATEYVGLEIDTPDTKRLGFADHFYDGGTFPSADAFFDSVVCNQVLEHVFNPRKLVSEIHRVLRGGGTLVLSVSSCWDEHEQPDDFARNSSFGVRHLLESKGFTVVNQQRTLCRPRISSQLLICFIYKKLHPRNIYLEVVFSALCYFPITVAGVLLGRLTPDNPDLYLDNVVLVRE